MKQLLSRFPALIAEIILTIGICCIIIWSSLASLQTEAQHYIDNVSDKYELTISKYITIFKAITIPVKEEIRKDPSFDEMELWLKHHEEQFKDAVGPNIYDGFAFTYKGRFAHSWSYGDYSNYDPNTRIWYQQAQKANGSIIIVAPYVTYLTTANQHTANPITLTVAQKYNNEISFDLDLKTTEINNLLLQDTAYGKTITMLFDDNGYILSANNTDYYSHNIHQPDSVISKDLSNSVRDTSQLNHFRFLKINGEYRLVYTAPGKSNNFVCLLVSFREVFIEDILAVVLIALLLIALEITIYIRNRRKLAVLSQNNLSNLRSIAYHYSLVLWGNIHKKSYIVLKNDVPAYIDSIAETPDNHPLQQILRQIVPSQQKDLCQSLTFSRIDSYLQKAATHSLILEFQDGHWYVAKLIRSINYAKSGEFFLCLENADEQMDKQKKLEKALIEAHAAVQAKTDFLSRMSHDIRTPLNGIIGMTGIAQKYIQNEKAMDCLQKIQSSGTFLLSLINDILDIAKIESGMLELHEEPTNLKEINTMLNAVIQPLMDKKAIHFTRKLSMNSDWAIIDMVRCNQIFFNLLSNSAKYTEKGGDVLFSATTLSDDGQTEWIRFIVRDTGIGMSDEFLAHAFNPFEQEHGNDTAQQWTGTGLGLAITKELTDKMNGKISIKSRKGTGTEITLDLPFKKCLKQPTSEARLPDSYATLPGKTILLAEDNDINTAVATAMLEDQGIIVRHAVNGKEAVEQFKNAPDEIDLILMDIMMPIMNGIEATKIIRALPVTKAAVIPIIAVTANAFNDDKKACMDAGMNAHIAKPIDPQELYRVLSQLL